MHLQLEPQEWNAVLAILAQAPWNVANPLIMKLGEQMRLQSANAGAGIARAPGNGMDEAPDALAPLNPAQRAS